MLTAIIDTVHCHAEDRLDPRTPFLRLAAGSTIFLRRARYGSMCPLSHQLITAHSRVLQRSGRDASRRRGYPMLISCHNIWLPIIRTCPLGLAG
jgi:hypothetical protein